MLPSILFVAQRATRSLRHLHRKRRKRRKGEVLQTPPSNQQDHNGPSDLPTLGRYIIPARRLPPERDYPNKRHHGGSLEYRLPPLGKVSTPSDLIEWAQKKSPPPLWETKRIPRNVIIRNEFRSWIDRYDLSWSDPRSWRIILKLQELTRLAVKYSSVVLDTPRHLMPQSMRRGIRDILFSPLFCQPGGKPLSALSGRVRGLLQSAFKASRRID